MTPRTKKKIPRARFQAFPRRGRRRREAGPDGCFFLRIVGF
jgi:hypothetical protein